MAKDWRDSNEVIGKRFVAARGGMPQREAERESGIGSSVFERCQNGRQIPNTNLLAYYFHAKGISSDLILYGKEAPPSKLFLNIEGAQPSQIITKREPTPLELAQIEILLLNLPLEQRMEFVKRLLTL